MQPSLPLEGAEIRNILGLPGGSRQDGVDGAHEAAVFGRFVPLSADHPAHETKRLPVPRLNRIVSTGRRRPNGLNMA